MKCLRYYAGYLGTKDLSLNNESQAGNRNKSQG